MKSFRKLLTFHSAGHCTGQHRRNLCQMSSLEVLSSQRLQLLSGVRAEEVKSLIRTIARATIRGRRWDSGDEVCFLRADIECDDEDDCGEALLRIRGGGGQGGGQFSGNGDGNILIGRSYEYWRLFAGFELDRVRRVGEEGQEFAEEER